MDMVYVVKFGNAMPNALHLTMLCLQNCHGFFNSYHKKIPSFEGILYFQYKYI